MPTLLDRFRDGCAADLLADLPIEVGSYEDFLALKAHHYRPGRPMTMTRILVTRDKTPTPSDRYLHRPPTPRPIAILIESLPGLSCWLREQALSGRYGHLRPKPRSALLNQELRCISRVIVDPRWRGLGLAVKLVKHALATATTRYTEALAVMGRVSPFFERAGMAVYQRPPRPTDERVLAALRYAGIEPKALALPGPLEIAIHALPDAKRSLLQREFTRWYRTAGGRGISRQPALTDIFAAAQQRLLAQPIYYLRENTHVHSRPAHPARPAD